MEFLAHRGYWNRQEEKNSISSFERAFRLGYGVETDIRDSNGELVISHDIPKGGEMSLSDFLTLYKKYDSNPTLALNIKADGLQEKLELVLKEYEVENYFVFDMSIPDSLGYIKRNFRVFSRLSEYEPSIAFEDKVEGIWLDAFNDIWYTDTEILSYLEKGLSIALVSPELHRRGDYIEFWKRLKDSGLYHWQNLYLCTDYPEKADSFFLDSTIDR